MQLKGLKCPQCLQEFDSCKLSISGRLIGICKACRVICFIEDYDIFLQKIAEMRRKTITYYDYRSKMPHETPRDQDPQKIQIYNPSKR